MGDAAALAESLRALTTANLALNLSAHGFDPRPRGSGPRYAVEAGEGRVTVKIGAHEHDFRICAEGETWRLDVPAPNLSLVLPPSSGGRALMAQASALAAEMGALLPAPAPPGPYHYIPAVRLSRSLFAGRPPVIDQLAAIYGPPVHHYPPLGAPPDVRARAVRAGRPPISPALGAEAVGLLLAQRRPSVLTVLCPGLGALVQGIRHQHPALPLRVVEPLTSLYQQGGEVETWDPLSYGNPSPRQDTEEAIVAVAETVPFAAFYSDRPPDPGCADRVDLADVALDLVRAGGVVALIFRPSVNQVKEADRRVRLVQRARVLAAAPLAAGPESWYCVIAKKREAPVDYLKVVAGGGRKTISYRRHAVSNPHLRWTLRTNMRDIIPHFAAAPDVIGRESLREPGPGIPPILGRGAAIMASHDRSKWDPATDPAGSYDPIKGGAAAICGGRARWFKKDRVPALAVVVQPETGVVVYKDLTALGAPGAMIPVRAHILGEGEIAVVPHPGLSNHAVLRALSCSEAGRWFGLFPYTNPAVVVGLLRSFPLDRAGDH